jgi:hypothetical protein
VPAAETVVVAAGKGFAPLDTPVVGSRAVKSAMDDGFMEPVIVVAKAIPLIGFGVGCTGEKQSTAQNSRSQNCFAKRGAKKFPEHGVLPGVSKTAVGSRPAVYKTLSRSKCCALEKAGLAARRFGVSKQKERSGILLRSGRKEEN